MRIKDFHTFVAEASAPPGAGWVHTNSTEKDIILTPDFTRKRDVSEGIADAMIADLRMTVMPGATRIWRGTIAGKFVYLGHYRTRMGDTYNDSYVVYSQGNNTAAVDSFLENIARK